MWVLGRNEISWFNKITGLENFEYKERKTVPFSYLSLLKCGFKSDVSKLNNRIICYKEDFIPEYKQLCISIWNFRHNLWQHGSSTLLILSILCFSITTEQKLTSLCLKKHLRRLRIPIFLTVTIVYKTNASSSHY